MLLQRRMPPIAASIAPYHGREKLDEIGKCPDRNLFELRNDWCRWRATNAGFKARQVVDEIEKRPFRSPEFSGGFDDQHTPHGLAGKYISARRRAEFAMENSEFLRARRHFSIEGRFCATTRRSVFAQISSG